MKTLKTLFLHELATMHDAEQRTIKAWPKIARAAVSLELKTTLRLHWKESEGHLKILERVFRLFGVKAKRKTCAATVGLLTEAHQIALFFDGSPALDAALISVVQKVEHYEIAAYGCLHEWAGLLGNDEAAFLLEEVLMEEKAADESLTELALRSSNRDAHQNSEVHNGKAGAPSKQRRGKLSANGYGNLAFPAGDNIWLTFGRRR